VKANEQQQWQIFLLIYQQSICKSKQNKNQNCITASMYCRTTRFPATAAVLKVNTALNITV